jgi:hypothetical protein
MKKKFRPFFSLHSYFNKKRGVYKDFKNKSYRILYGIPAEDKISRKLFKRDYLKTYLSNGSINYHYQRSNFLYKFQVQQ